MGYRLSKIYTKTGDSGTTGLGDGSRVKKCDPRVDGYGEIDELNSVIGVLLTHDLPADLRENLLEIQHDLFDLGGELSIPGFRLLKAERVSDLEKLLDSLNDQLKPLQEFILPGGSPSAAFCHLARTVCRRAERRLVSLSEASDVGEIGIQYLNRLSDLLFVMARFLNKHEGKDDVLWNRQRSSHQDPE
ncbi:MAG: cob(I)yrinic acid a,c-diamide adenosyltransferase [Acidobacteriota bacterium]|nr:MAG: cob(I)yrinic acid a,c-diamide adenosyltransferase [Acidobacteriota bacterium]